MRKGCQIPKRFSSPLPNGELMLASTFTVGSTVPFFSDTSRENARMSEIIIYDGKEKEEEKFQLDNCHGTEKYLLGDTQCASTDAIYGNHGRKSCIQLLRLASYARIMSVTTLEDEDKKKRKKENVTE